MNFELKRVPEWNASELASGPRAEPFGKLTGLPVPSIEGNLGIRLYKLCIFSH